jgi:hypothetical protein
MNETQYVWHVSCAKAGEGPKWALTDNNNGSEAHWQVHAREDRQYHLLPRSEYILCPLPKRWERVEVTVSSVIDQGSYREQPLYHEGAYIGLIKLDVRGYRVTSMVAERRTQ